MMAGLCGLLLWIDCSYIDAASLHLLRHWSVGDLDLLRQSNPVGGLAARASRDLSCPHPSGHGAASALACVRSSRRADTKSGSETLRFDWIQDTDRVHGGEKESVNASEADKEVQVHNFTPDVPTGLLTSWISHLDGLLYQDVGQLFCRSCGAIDSSHLSPSSSRFRGAAAPLQHNHDFPAASRRSRWPLPTVAGRFCSESVRGTVFFCTVYRRFTTIPHPSLTPPAAAAAWMKW